MFLADLHIHSTFSDGKLSIPEIVDLYGSKGYGAIAITDHLHESNSLLGKAAIYSNRTLTPAVFPLYEEILKSETDRAWKQYNMVVIPGIEFTKKSMASHESARILGLGVTQFTSADGDVRDLTRTIRAQGGVTVASHPVSKRKLSRKTKNLWDHRDELKDEFDAWEVSNGTHLFPEILASSLPKIASSGMHSAKQMNSWKTVFFCERNPNAILDGIRSQDVRFVLR